MYLDQGFDAARDLLLRVAAPELDADEPIRALKAPKSRLQELTLASSGTPPTYRVVSAEGPDHAKRFRVEVLVDGEAVAAGEGSNRRTAETEAAARALERLSPREAAGP